MNDTYTAWKERLDGALDRQVLEAMTPPEIADAFSGSLAFGTGGLRGVMGLGTNRINRYTVERVTHGLAGVILSRESPKSAGIAHDTRYNSAEYAQIVCDVLSAYGIDVRFFDRPMPTPALSFAIRHLKLGWGVVITASHNPQEYNGYKVYDSRGVQVTDQLANVITDAINSVAFFKPLPEGRKGLSQNIEPTVESAYLDQIISFVQTGRNSSEFPLVYSALHGTGANVVPSVLIRLGYSPVCIQQDHDGSFGGIKTPNPEDPTVYEIALKEAKKCGAKLILATDPDCDRVGVMVNTQSGFRLLDGNQIGALLIDYLVKTRGVYPGDTVVTTIVSGLLGEHVAKANGLDFVRLLTGFKYIGEFAERLPEDKRFFFGYEESYGFLAGDGARDKDAVIASALIVRMADYYNQMEIDLYKRWEDLSKTHGYCLERLHSLDIPLIRQKEIMTKLREWVSFKGLVRVDDYLLGIDGLHPSDVVKLYFDGSGWAAIRPSGTETKIKLYVGVREATLAAAELRLKSLADELSKALVCMVDNRST